MPDVTFSFLCGIRGYHEYHIVWTPVLNEILEAKHKFHNCHDCYAISVLKCLHGSDTVIGHLPWEISRFTYFIILHGAQVSCRITDTHHRRSPLVQGGLEIQCEVIIKMLVSDQNLLAMEEYRQLICGNYTEPIDGSFPDVTNDIWNNFGHSQTMKLNLTSRKKNSTS